MTIGQSKPLEKCEKEGRRQRGREEKWRNTEREREREREMTMAACHFAPSISEGNSGNLDTAHNEMHQTDCTIDERPIGFPRLYLNTRKVIFLRPTARG